jgi:hypothetical protein
VSHSKKHVAGRRRRKVKVRAVVIPLAMQHYVLLQRNLIYTGITRGKELLVLVGQRMALGIAVRNDRPQRRYSGLLASLKGDGWAVVGSLGSVRNRPASFQQDRSYDERT